MSKTFEDYQGQTRQIIDGITFVETEEDIVSGKISGYFVTQGDEKFEVSKTVYTALKSQVKL
jgi:hypothetical protein